MSAMVKLKYYTDPGHGWVAVKRKMLIENGVLNRITPFSISILRLTATQPCPGSV